MFKGRRRNLHWGGLNMAELELDKLILHFEQSNKAEGKSPKTITWYTEMITGFTRFLTGTGRRPVLAEFDISTVREFIIHEQERDLSPYTVQGKVKLIQGIRPGTVAISWSYGHWAYGSNDVVIDGETVPGDPRRGTGIVPNPAMWLDPVVGDVCLTDPIGGSASFYDTRVRLEKA
jgi:hypothetical protein